MGKEKEKGEMEDEKEKREREIEKGIFNGSYLGDEVVVLVLVVVVSIPWESSSPVLCLVSSQIFFLQ